MTRRPWWNKPEWTRHVATTPASDATRPREERCGMTAAEQVTWIRTTAYEGIDMDARFTQVKADQQRIESPADPPATPGWHTWVGYLIGLIVLFVLIGGISS